MKPSKFDIAAMIIIPIVAAIVTLFFHSNLFTSILLFLALPAAYLVLINPGIFKKSFIFALLLSIPLSLFLDVLATINKSWVITKTVFPFKILGEGTIEVYLMGFFWVLFAVLFYEHFFDKGTKKDKISPHIKYLAYICIALILYTFIAFFFYKPLLHVPYFYLVSGMFLVLIPLLVFLYQYPSFLPRYILIGVYFFFVLFLFEIVALQNGQWIFPASDFIGFVKIFGYRFPVEELIIWITAGTVSLLSYYEFFADDRLL